MSFKTSHMQSSRPDHNVTHEGCSESTRHQQKPKKDRIYITFQTPTP